MPCRQVSTYNGVFGSGKTGGGGYATEAECLQACGEGACCEGTTCSVKPQCQCQGAGKTFKGVGTVCTPNPCGCCCVDGAPTTKTEQECAATGGSWKTYSCGTQAPSSILLTLSLTNYTTVFENSNLLGGGTWDFDFSCIKSSYTLKRSPQRAAWFPSAGGTFMNDDAGQPTEAVVVMRVSTTGSFAAGFSNATCGCPVAMFEPVTLWAHHKMVATRRGGNWDLSCVTQEPASLSNTLGFTFVPQGKYMNQGSLTIEVPGFCSNDYSLAGTVWGPGSNLQSVYCGTYTLGNPLP